MAANASKGINAHMLRAPGCTSHGDARRGTSRVPGAAEEPPQWTQHRGGVAGIKARTTGEAGTVYQKGPAGAERARADRGDFPIPDDAQALGPRLIGGEAVPRAGVGFAVLIADA